MHFFTLICEGVQIFYGKVFRNSPSPPPAVNIDWLEVNKCAFTFSSKIRPIQFAHVREKL